MNKLFISTLLFISFIGTTWAQNNSYFFKEPVPPNQKATSGVDARFFGEYEDEKGFKFIFNAKGIFSEATLLLSISREIIRESSKYTIKGNYLFGVVENDSVEYVLNGDNYYYGLKDRIEVVGSNSKNIIVKKGSDYYINFIDGDYYTPAKITFRGSQMEISYFDYPTDKNVFSEIKKSKKKKKEHIVEIILNPTADEWSLLDHEIIFPEKRIFKKL